MENVKLVNLWIMNCLFREVKVQEGCEKEVKNRA